MIRNENILEVKSLNLSYGKNTILQDINMSLKKGEIISIIGPSGCGKSTLLKAIGGISPDFDGEIYFEKIRSKELLQKEDLFFKNLLFLVG